MSNANLTPKQALLVREATMFVVQARSALGFDNPAKVDIALKEALKCLEQLSAFVP